MNSLLVKDKNSMYPQLHNNYALKFGDHIARILEYEIYDWNDPYTHRNERQRLYEEIKDEEGNISKKRLVPPNTGSICAFYIHRSKKGKDDPYKQASYKGIDIIIHGGILIRSILVVTPYDQDVNHLCKVDNRYGGTLIEGPSLVVDHMCNLTGWSLADLEGNLKLIKCNWDMKAEYQDSNNAIVSSQYPIYLGSRVGLTMKRAPIGQTIEDTPCKDPLGHDINSWARHLIMPLRSCTFIPSKEKETFFVVNNDRKDIPSRTTRYQEEHIQGKITNALTTSMTQLQVAGYLSAHV